MNQIDRPTMWKHRGLDLGKGLVQAGLFAPIQGIHLSEEAVVFKIPLILVMSVSESHIELDSLQDDATL